MRIIAFTGGTCKQIFQTNFAEQSRMNASTHTDNAAPAMRAFVEQFDKLEEIYKTGGQVPK